MPNPLISKYAKETKKTLKEVEGFWDKAIQVAQKDKRKPTDGDYYPFVVGAFKKMLNIKEEVESSAMPTTNTTTIATHYKKMNHGKKKKVTIKPEVVIVSHEPKKPKKKTPVVEKDTTVFRAEYLL